MTFEDDDPEAAYKRAFLLKKRERDLQREQAGLADRANWYRRIRFGMIPLVIFGLVLIVDFSLPRKFSSERGESYFQKVSRKKHGGVDEVYCFIVTQTRELKVPQYLYENYDHETKPELMVESTRLLNIPLSVSATLDDTFRNYGLRRGFHSLGLSAPLLLIAFCAFFLASSEYSENKLVYSFLPFLIFGLMFLL
jgi:hypothetical protein